MCANCSILGMNLFGCKFCEVLPDGSHKCWRKNFDSLLWAIITVFQVTSRWDLDHVRYRIGLHYKHLIVNRIESSISGNKAHKSKYKQKIKSTTHNTRRQRNSKHRDKLYSKLSTVYSVNCAQCTSKLCSSYALASVNWRKCITIRLLQLFHRREYDIAAFAITVSRLASLE